MFVSFESVEPLDWSVCERSKLTACTYRVSFLCQPVIRLRLNDSKRRGGKAREEEGRESMLG